MPKCDLNKVALLLYFSIKLLCYFIEIKLQHGCFLVNLLHIYEHLSRTAATSKMERFVTIDTGKGST